MFKVGTIKHEYLLATYKNSEGYGTLFSGCEGLSFFANILVIIANFLPMPKIVNNFYLLDV